MKLFALVVLVAALQVIDAAPRLDKREAEESEAEYGFSKRELEEFEDRVVRGLLDNIPVIGNFIEGFTDVPILGPIAGDILRALNIMKKREAELIREKRGLLSQIPVAGTLLESLGEIPLVGGVFDGLFHGLGVLKKREMEVPEENAERVERGLLSQIPVAGTLLESLGEIPLVGGVFDGLFHGLGVLKREVEVREKREVEVPEEDADRVARGLLSQIPVAGTLLESLGEIPLVGGVFDGLFHGLGVLKREVDIPENAAALMKVVREMEIPEGASPEEAHHYIKRQLCAEIPIIRKWCHSVAEVPLVGPLIEGVAKALNIMKK